MVYCTKCGTKNEEDATLCVKCKEPMSSYQTVSRERRQKESECFGRQQKESECFGLPYGGAIVGLVIGLIIVLWGVTSVLDINFGSYLWTIIIIIFGTLIVAGALYSMNRGR